MKSSGSDSFSYPISESPALKKITEESLCSSALSIKNKHFPFIFRNKQFNSENLASKIIDE